MDSDKLRDNIAQMEGTGETFEEKAEWVLQSLNEIDEFIDLNVELLEE